MAIKVDGKNPLVKNTSLLNGNSAEGRNLQKKLLGTSAFTFAEQHPNYKPDTSAGAAMW